MVNERLLRKCLDDMNKLEIRLSEIDRKIDHIIFRLREMDPRISVSGANTTRSDDHCL